MNLAAKLIKQKKLNLNFKFKKVIFQYFRKSIQKIIQTNQKHPPEGGNTNPSGGGFSKTIKLVKLNKPIN